MSETKKKKFDISKLTLPLMAAFLIFGLLVFLISKDNGISGFDALALQNTSFWVFGALGLAMAIVFGYLALDNESKVGGQGKTILYIALALIFLTAPFGKACTTKADPVIAPGYKALLK